MSPPEEPRNRTFSNLPAGSRNRVLSLNIASQILRIGWPLIVTQCAGVLMQVTDALFVARLGDTALAAISPGYLVALLPISIGLGIVATVSSFVSQSMGSGRRQKCAHFASAGLWISLLVGIFAILLIPTAPFAFGLFGHSIEVYELEVRYFHVSMYSVGFQTAAMALSAYFIGIHRPMTAMTGTIVATLANIFFDYVFIFGKLGFPELGFDGAATGTVAAAFTQFAFMIVAFCIESKRAGTLSLSIFSFTPGKAFQLLRVGTPYGLQSCLEVLATGVILIWLIGLFGDAHLAAATIVIRCAMISHIPPEGIASGLTALVGKSIGEQRNLLADLQVRIAFRLVAGYITLIALGFILFRNGLAGLFSSNPEVIRIGGIALALVAFFQVLDTMSIIYGSALRAAGDTFWPMMVNAVLCAVIFIGGGLLTVNFLPHWGSVGVWLVDGLYVLAQGIAFHYRWRSGTWKSIALLDREKDSPVIGNLPSLPDHVI